MRSSCWVLVSEWFVVFGMLIIQTLLTSSILEDTFLLPLPVSAKHETRYKQRHPKPATKSSAPNPQVWKVLKNSLKGFRVCCLLFFFVPCGLSLIENLNLWFTGVWGSKCRKDSQTPLIICFGGWMTRHASIDVRQTSRRILLCGCNVQVPSSVMLCHARY